MELVRLLLAKMGVTALAGAHVHRNIVFTLEEFHIRYDNAFKDKKVVVAIAGVSRELYVVSSVEQLFDNRDKFELGGIDMVVGIPRDLWEEIRPTISSEIHDLAVVAA